MAWRCRLVDHPRFGADEPRPQIGDMWFAPAMVEKYEHFYLDHQLSHQYKEQHLGKRPPLIVYLPPGFSFCVDDAYRGGHWGDNPAREGWTVTGEAPNITVAPSINCVGTYHGWLQNGVLSDDVEGRAYPIKEQGEKDQ